MKYDIEIKNRAIELYNLGKSTKEVSKELNIHKSIIYRWIVNAGIIRSVSDACKGRIMPQEQKDKLSEKLKGKFTGEFRYNFKKLKHNYDIPSKELSYILGVLFGDGFLSIQGTIGLQSIDREFVDEFSRCFEFQFGHKPAIYDVKPRLIQVRKSEKYYMQQKSYNLRIKSVGAKQFLESIKNWDYILNLSKEYKISFIRGLWDSEGIIGVNNNKYCQVKFCNKNYDLANKYKYLLKEVTNIDSHINITKHEMCYVSFAKTNDVIKFYKEINPTIKRKRNIIEKVLLFKQ